MKKNILILFQFMLIAFVRTSSLNAQEYVDLGLPSGLKWATCNIGASSPFDSGEYYSWGEIEAKPVYEVGKSLLLEVDIEDISGNKQYDVARAKLGGSWRMPKEAEFRELMDNCSWEWVKENGKVAYRIVGPNGNHIILPAAGMYEDEELKWVGEYGQGYYWTSTPDEEKNYNSKLFHYYFGGQEIYKDFRCYGCTVRPVK